MGDPDLVMAYRLMYYVWAVSFIPDHEYDKLERAARKTVPPDHPLHQPGSDQLDSYEPAIRALALYLRLRFSKRTPTQEDKRRIRAVIRRTKPKLKAMICTPMTNQSQGPKQGDLL